MECYYVNALGFFYASWGAEQPCTRYVHVIMCLGSQFQLYPAPGRGKQSSLPCGLYHSCVLYNYSNILGMGKGCSSLLQVSPGIMPSLIALRAGTLNFISFVHEAYLLRLAIWRQ